MKEDLKSHLLKEIVHDRFSNPKQALENSIKLYQESVVSFDYYYASIAKFYEGDAYLSLDELTKACESLLDSVQLQQTHGYSDYLGKCYNVLGAVFYSQCDYVLAMKYFLNALDVATEIKDYYTQALIYNNIAAVFLLYNDFSHSRQFFMKALHGKINKQSASETDHYIITKMHMNVGICFASEGKTEEAKRYLNEVLSEITDEEAETVCMYIEEMGIHIYKKTGETDQALDYALRMVKNAEKYCNLQNIIVTFECIHFLIEESHFEEAKTLLRIVQKVSQKNESFQNEHSILKEWIFYYTKLGEQAACNHYYQKYYQLIQKNKESNLQNQITALENRNLLTKMMDTNQELLLQKDEFEKKTSIDSLTGLLNRNGMKHLVDSMLSKNKKNYSMINLAIIDIDQFKQFNDKYGHLTGDQCIKEIAQVIQSMETKRIHGVRFGGDEFLLIGNGISEKTWENIVQKIQKSFKEKKIITKNHEMVSITTSIGVFSHIPDPVMEFHDYIHCADLALYQVKQNGRNHYRIYVEDFETKEVFHEL